MTSQPGTADPYAVVSALHAYLSPHPALGMDMDDDGICVACRLIVTQVELSQMITDA